MLLCLAKATVSAAVARFERNAASGRTSAHRLLFMRKCRDEALGLPTDHAARIARNTQIHLQHEANMAHVIDPFGGSYLLEQLTQGLEARATAHIEEVEAIWARIAEDDDWAPLTAKVAAIRAMGEAYRD